MVGAAHVARYLIGLFHRAIRPPDLRIELVNCNNTPAMAVYGGDHLEGVYLIEVVDDTITNFYAFRNPDKLATVAIPRRISR